MDFSPRCCRIRLFDSPEAAEDSFIGGISVETNNLREKCEPV
jgi:hypothetical protein